ncbi:hypothetical protein GOP47_0030650, partial [Adiantum capillus-veneris]
FEHTPVTFHVLRLLDERSRSHAFEKSARFHRFAIIKPAMITGHVVEVVQPCEDIFGRKPRKRLGPNLGIRFLRMWSSSGQ